MTTIADIFAWEALDSRGTPTVACELTLDEGASGTAIVPSGASTGRYEAHELRDGGTRYGGRGVTRAVGSVNGELRECLVGGPAGDQAALDAAMRDLDGTADLSRLGANALLAVSIAFARAAAAAAGLPLHAHLAGGAPPLVPMPMVNVVSGGAHARGTIDVQDFLVIPVGAQSFAEAIEWAGRVRAATAAVAEERGFAAGLVADEGGLGLPLATNRDGLELLARGIDRSDLAPGADVAIAIDVAASQFFDGQSYRFAVEDRRLDAGEVVDELERWASAHPIVSLEDALAEEDWEGWRVATDRIGDRLQLIGDDLFATNLARLERGIEQGVGNAILVKPNQIGTLSDARAALARAQDAGFATIVSGRSGDTEDAWLSDLAVGWAAGQVKIGSTMRSERTAKWNRLLQIEARPGDASTFAGRAALPAQPTSRS